MELLSLGWWITEVVIAILAVAIGFVLGLFFDRMKEKSDDKKKLKETMESLQYEIGEVYKILCCGNVTVDDINKDDVIKEKIEKGTVNEGLMYIDTPIWDSLVATGKFLEIRDSYERVFGYANYVFKEVKRIEKKQMTEQYKNIDELKKEIFDMKEKLIKDMREKIGAKELINFVLK